MTSSQNKILLQQTPTSSTIQKNTTMKSSRQYTAKLMLLLVVSLIDAPLADAFGSSATANRPISIPFEATSTKQEKRRLPRTSRTNDENAPTATTIVVEKMKTKRRNMIKYDLGLGKNQPFNNDNGNELSSGKRIHPTQFLVEHESVRPYPSPLNLDSQSHSSNNRNEAKDKRKTLPKVQPIRQSKDVLHIRDPNIHMGNTKEDDNAFGHPVIVPINHSSVGRNEPAVKFDLNTVWVEMMLHSEYKKLILTN